MTNLRCQGPNFCGNSKNALSHSKSIIGRTACKKGQCLIACAKLLERLLNCTYLLDLVVAQLNFSKLLLFGLDGSVVQQFA